MEEDYGSNVHVGLEKSVRLMECPLWRGFVIRDSFGIRPGQNFFFVRLREVSALEDVRFREVPPYIHLSRSYHRWFQLRNLEKFP